MTQTKAEMRQTEEKTKQNCFLKNTGKFGDNEQEKKRRFKLL